MLVLTWNGQAPTVAPAFPKRQRGRAVGADAGDMEPTAKV
jgi:hypothetical protein